MRTRFFLLILCWFFPIAIFANPRPLPAKVAFQLHATLGTDHTVSLQWKIAPNYHLYRQQFKFKILKPKGTSLGHILMPSGKAMQDAIFGRYQAYYDNVTITVPILEAPAKPVVLQVQYQGCSDAGFCYPLTTRELRLNFSTGLLSLNEQSETSTVGKIASLLEKENLFWVILGFMGFGILLCFTPCVLPMLPILSTIVLGQKHLSVHRAFTLALSYVLGMALSYALAGILAASLGETLQASLQNPWVLSSFSAVFVLLALSLFGFYELQLPRALRERVDQLSHQQRAGTHLGGFIMGALATLIISPCVTPPLIGVLTYIGQTHDRFIGGIALFSLGLGMGLPLLAFATVGSHFLPKSGAWLVGVKHAFGVLMLAVAVWLLERVIPGQLTMMLWAALLIFPAVQLGAFSASKTTFERFRQALGIMMLCYGILLLFGAGLGNIDPLEPLKGLPIKSPNYHPLPTARSFERVTSSTELDKLLASAKQNHQPVLLGFHADWCATCQEMERYTFPNPNVQAALATFVLIRADVTKNNAQSAMLQKRYDVIAPPVILFFDASGSLHQNATLVGKQTPETLVPQIESILREN